MTDWVARDERRHRDLDGIVGVLELSPPSRVLDVGGGYGYLTRLVLERFPGSQVVLHDFSQPMLDRAVTHLDGFSDRYVACNADLRDPRWVEVVGRHFDAVVSAHAIHNVRDPEVIARIYGDLLGCLRPGGRFVDLDYIRHDQAAVHRGWLLDAGFDPPTVRADIVDADHVLLVAQRVVAPISRADT